MAAALEPSAKVASAGSGPSTTESASTGLALRMPVPDRFKQNLLQVDDLDFDPSVWVCDKITASALGQTLAQQQQQQHHHGLNPSSAVEAVRQVLSAFAMEQIFSQTPPELLNAALAGTEDGAHSVEIADAEAANEDNDEVGSAAFFYCRRCS